MPGYVDLSPLGTFFILPLAGLLALSAFAIWQGAT